jgi:hypothetical protein
MPTPKKGESRKKFVGRCVPYVMQNEGVTDASHAAAKCHGIFDQSKKISEAEEADAVFKEHFSLKGEDDE